MRARSRVVPIVLLAAAAAAGRAQQEDFDKVEVKASKVAGSVWMLDGEGGNIAASVGADGIVLVDDQFAPLAPKIQLALHDITDKPIRFIVNTHWHPDHTGGNAVFGPIAPILAHDNVRKRLAAGASVPGRVIEPAKPEALPVVTFDDGVVVHLNGEDVRVVHLPPGHTDGDVIVWFTASNVVHMGDDFVTYGFPFVDLHSGGSVKGLIDALHQALAKIPSDAKIIPGHGKVSTVEDVKKLLAMLEETYAIVDKGVKAGKTLDQLKAAKVLAAYDRYSGEFVSTDKYLDMVYEDITSGSSRK